MKLFKFLFLITILAFTFSACHKDKIIETTTNSTTPTPNIFGDVNGNVAGYGYNETGQPVPDAIVTIYSGSTTTDDYGVFRFNEVKLNELGTYLKVEKSGYLLGSDFITPVEGTNFSYVHLYSLNTTGTFSSNDGGAVNIEGGGQVVFSPSSIIDQNGGVYSGIVNVTAKRLDPDDIRLGDKMPGSLRAKASNGNTVVLSTFGMLAIELRDDAGNKLNIKDGFTASISSPIAASQLDNAPNEIPLWYFDEVEGIWKEDGVASKIGDNYVGEVSHFTWWNYDAWFPIITLCVQVLFENGEPASNYAVNVSSEISGGINKTGWTNSEGHICGDVPKDEELIISIIAPYCNEVIYTTTVGPFNNNVVLDDIILPLPPSLGEGHVECNGNFVSNAQVILNYTVSGNNLSTIVPVNDDGAFDLNFTNILCSNISSAEIFAYEITTGNASSTVELDLTAPNTIILNICNDCDFIVNITTDIISNCEVDSLVTLTADVVGTGNYSYLWSNGATSQTVSDLSAGLYCVTVTNIDAGCDVSECYTFSTIYPLEIYGEYTNPSCGLNNGMIYPFAWGGTLPYSFYTEGPNGYSSSGENILENLEPGTYVMTVTDANGCSANATFELVDDPNLNISLNPYQYCGVTHITTYIYVGGDWTYEWSTGDTEIGIDVLTPGTYCVTATSSEGCVLTDCVDVDITDAPSLENMSCNKNIYSFDNPNPGPMYIFSPPNSFSEYTEQPVVDVDVFIYDYNFWAVHDTLNYCNDYDGSYYGQAYSLPHYNGLIDFSSTNTTCGTCNDGGIIYAVTGGGDCYNCTEGSTAIYAEGDYDTNLTSEGLMNQLSAGTYYIVVLDQDTGCIIAHEEVIIE